MFENMELSKISLADDFGRVYISEDKVYRTVNAHVLEHVKSLFASGLVDDLVRQNLLVKTKFVEMNKDEGGAVFLEHEKIKPLSFPFEWSPEMLRSAAICTLMVNEIAMRYGFQLKDAHPYNIMFKGGSPIFIDFGSIVAAHKNNNWIAFNQFLWSFYYPLKICEKGYKNIYKNIFLLSDLMANGAEMVVIVNKFAAIAGLKNTEKILKLISFYKNLSEGGSWVRHFSSPTIVRLINALLKRELLPFRRINMEKILVKLKNINLKGESKWGNYHRSAGFYDPNDQIILTSRMRWVVELVRKYKPKTVIELAGNQGILSKVIASLDGVEQVICSDYDEKAVDVMYLNLAPGGDIYPMNFDFMGEIWQSLSEERYKRLKSDFVIALAVTHHLILTQKYSLDEIVSRFAKYTYKYMIVEFMPLGLWDGGEYPEIPDWYTEAWFLKHLELKFDLIEKKQLEANRIGYFCKLKNIQI
jgi:hypothetical protein